MMCLKCWRDAWDGGHYNGCESQAERYAQLLSERADNPCTPKEQAGEYWDETTQTDTRSGGSVT